MPSRWVGKGGEEDGEGDEKTADLERVGGKWRTIAKDRRNWRLLIAKVVREKWGKERR